MKVLARSRLLEVLGYDPETGEFCRKIRAGRIPPGKIQNVPTGHGYVYISIDNQKYFAHHLAWLWVYGREPTEIDHINGLKTDNRISNLREATRSQNLYNKTTERGDLKGISYDRSRKKWMAYIVNKHVMKNLGRFDSKEEAQAVREVAARSLHGEFYRR